MAGANVAWVKFLHSADPSGSCEKRDRTGSGM